MGLELFFWEKHFAEEANWKMTICDFKSEFL